MAMAAKRTYGNYKKAYKVGQTVGKFAKRFVRQKPRNTRKSTNRNIGNQLQQISQHNDLSVKKLFISSGRKTIHDKTRTKFKYIHTLSSVANGTEGRQYVYSPRFLFTAAQFLNGSAIRNDAYGVGRGFFSMNPNFRTTGTFLLPGGTNSESFMNVESLNIKMTLINGEAVPLTVNILWVTPKFATNDSPGVTWDLILSQQLNGITPQAMTGLPDNAATYGSINSSTVPGMYPTKTPGFTSRWKILKTSKIVLQGGDSQINHISYAVNKRVQKSFIDQTFNDGNLFIPGLTLIPLVIIKGSAIFSQNNLTYSRSQLGVIFEENYVFSTSKSPPEAPTTTGYFGTITATDAVPETFMDDTDSVRTNVRVI